MSWITSLASSGALKTTSEILHFPSLLPIPDSPSSASISASLKGLLGVVEGGNP